LPNDIRSRIEASQEKFNFVLNVFLALSNCTANMMRIQSHDEFYAIDR